MTFSFPNIVWYMLTYSNVTEVRQREITFLGINLNFGWTCFCYFCYFSRLSVLIYRFFFTLVRFVPLVKYFLQVYGIYLFLYFWDLQKYYNSVKRYTQYMAHINTSIW